MPQAVSGASSRDPMDSAYQDIFGRAPTQQEQNAFQQALVQGETPDRARSALAHSDAAEAQIDGVWEQVLGRSVDATGLATAENMLASGATLGDLRNMAAHSTEAAGDVTAFYADTLGVGPSATNLANCEDALAAGQSLAAQQAFLRPNFAQSGRPRTRSKACSRASWVARLRSRT